MLGELACLAAALLWALSVFLFRPAIARWGAQMINLAKGVVATIMLALTVTLLGSWPTLLDGSGVELGLLAASGLVGITLGDTALFAAVVRIGVHRSLLLLTLAPVFTAALARAMVDERLTTLQLTGGIGVLVGVILVVLPERRAAAQPLARAGIALGLLAAFGQGAGVVLAKSGMATIPAIPATLLRLAAASLGLILVFAVRRDLGRTWACVRHWPTMRRVVPTALVGTFVAMTLMMVGIALAPASVAAVLLATTPVFSLFLEWGVDGKRPTVLSTAGTTLAVLGVALLGAA